MSLLSVLQLCAISPIRGRTSRYEIPLLLPSPESTHPARPFLWIPSILHASRSAAMD